jgi:hypothetical protein
MEIAHDRPDMRIKNCLTILPLVLACNSMCMANDVSAEWFLNTEAKLQHDSNLDNAGYSEDIVNDSAFSVSAAGGKFIQLDDSDSLSIEGEFNDEAYDRYDGMDNASLGVSLTLRRKWALGLYAPWTSLSGSAAHLTYNENIRDGWLYQAQLSGGKRLTERWDIWADLLLEKRTADHAPAVDPGVSGAVFDQTSNTIKLNAVYALDNTTYLNFSYQLRHGDVASTILQDRPGSNFDSVMTAVTADPTFGPEAEVYRLTGTTQMLGARISMNFATNFATGLEYQRQITHAKGDNNYSKNLPALTLSYSY